MVFDFWPITIYLLASCWFKPPLANHLYSQVEIWFSAVARNKRACVCALFLGTILVRLALLPIFPVPEPSIHDEFCYLLQGDMFAHGRLAYPPHPMASYFETFYVTFQPAYAVMYPPAQGTVLALGELLGEPWIGVVLCTAGMVAALLWMLQGWVPARWALLGAIIFLSHVAIFSYWMNSYWGGSVATLGAALALGAFPRLKRRSRPRDAILFGVGTIILANSRTLEGFIFCLPLAAALLVWLVDLKRRGLPLPLHTVVLPILICVFANLAFTAYYNWRLTGDTFRFPRSVYYQHYYSVSPFIWGKIGPPRHYSNAQFDRFFNGSLRGLFDGTPQDLFRSEKFRFLQFRLFFLGGPLTFVFAATPWLLRDRRFRIVLFQFALCLLGIACVTWFEPHYASPAACALLLLMVQSFRHMRQWRWQQLPLGLNCTRQIVTLVLFMIPISIYQLVRVPNSVTGWNYRPVYTRASVETQLREIPGDHLAIVRYAQNHDPNQEWVYNAADIDRSKIVWAREVPGIDLGPLLAYYTGRKVWLVQPDSQPPVLAPYSVPLNSKLRVF